MGWASEFKVPSCFSRVRFSSKKDKENPSNLSFLFHPLGGANGTLVRTEPPRVGEKFQNFFKMGIREVDIHNSESACVLLRSSCSDIIMTLKILLITEKMSE